MKYFYNIDESVKGENNSQESELLYVASLVGCDIEFNGERPQSKKAQKLLYSSVREALTSAVKYGKASKLIVNIDDAEKNCNIRITDNGIYESNPIFTDSGLVRFKKKIDQEGAQLDLSYEGRPVFFITIPKLEVKL